MSRIADRMKEMKEMKEFSENIEEKKTIVTVKLDIFQVFCLDSLIKLLGGNRTSTMTEIGSEGILEGLEALGVSLDELQAKFLAQKSEHESDLKSDRKKTGSKEGESHV